MLGFLKKKPPTPRPSRNEEPGAHQRTQQALSDAMGADIFRDWSKERGPVRDQDLHLSDMARRWVDEMPQGLAPQQLAKEYPRIANRLALCWNDPKLATAVLDSLLTDKRGGRRGFPRGIDQELRALRADARGRVTPGGASPSR